MEKMIWSKPEMNEFAFAANEYVSTCGQGKCDTWAGQVDLIGAVYKLFFAWTDSDNDGIAKKDEVDLNHVVNSSNIPCEEDFHLEGTYQTVASPTDVYFRKAVDGSWTPWREITDSTTWETAYHFESVEERPNGQQRINTHLCKNFSETSKS